MVSVKRLCWQRGHAHYSAQLLCSTILPDVDITRVTTTLGLVSKLIQALPSLLGHFYRSGRNRPNRRISWNSLGNAWAWFFDLSARKEQRCKRIRSPSSRSFAVWFHMGSSNWGRWIFLKPAETQPHRGSNCKSLAFHRVDFLSAAPPPVVCSLFDIVVCHGPILIASRVLQCKEK